LHVPRIVRRTLLLGAAAFLLLVTGCGRPLLSPDDALVAPDNHDIRLVAYLERELPFGFRDGVEHALVQFHLEGRRVGQARTDHEGCAALECARPEPASKTFRTEATLAGHTVSAAGRVFEWDHEQIVIVVDIDKTIAHPDYDKLMLEEKDNDSEPIAGSHNVLKELAEQYRILYLTGRPRCWLEKTRAWLAEHDYPPGPVLAAPELKDALKEAKFKRRILRELREDWPEMLIGIGDKRGDADAYGANDMLALIIAEKRDDDLGLHAIALPDWKTLGRFFDTNHELLSDEESLRRVIRREQWLAVPTYPYEDE
jgi:hypothetical protein